MKRWSAFAMAGLFLIALGFVVKTNLLDKPLRPLPRLLLRFELRSDTTGQALILFNNSQGGYFPIQRADAFQPVSLPIPETPLPLWGIRLEPAKVSGTVSFRNFLICEETGRILKSIDAAREIESLNPGTGIAITNGELRVSVARETDHAVLWFKGIFPVRTALDTLPRVTPAGLVIVWLALGGIVAGLLIRLARVSARSGRSVVLWVAGVFLAVFGARLTCLLFLGLSWQHWDPWDHEAWCLFLPYMDGGLSWKTMFSPLNEHRVFFTRVLTLGQFLVNGQWDNRCNCLLTAGLYAAFAAGLWTMLSRVVRGRLWIAAALTLLAAAVPFSWENIVWGIQSQFYFFMGFSLLTLWFLVVSPAFSAGWWFGAFCALAALVTVGSGVAPTAVVVAVVLLRLLKERRGWTNGLATLGACGVVLAIYATLSVSEHNYGMLTKNVAQGITTFCRCMSWPFGETRWMWPLLWWPMAVWAWRRLAGRAPVPPASWFLFALAGFGVMNALGMAVYRGGYGGGPISRYMDLTAMFVVANGMALAQLDGEWDSRSSAARLVRTAGAAWAGLVLLGVIALTCGELRVSAFNRMDQQRRARQNIIQFLRDDNLQRIMTQREYELPHPDPMFLSACLRNDRIRSFLPASIREPVPVTPRMRAGFTPYGIHPRCLFDIVGMVWGSFGQHGNLGQGEFESVPLRPLRFPYLEFEVQGDSPPPYYDVPSVHLHLKDPGTGRERRASWTRICPGRWFQMTFRVPCETPIVVGVDQDPVWWLAFTEPREKSRVSVWTDAAIDIGPWVLGIGLIVLGIALSGIGTPRPTPPSAVPAAKEPPRSRKSR